MRLNEEARDLLRRVAHQTRWGGATATDVEDLQRELEADPAYWDETDDEIVVRLRELLRQFPGEYTKTGLGKAAGGKPGRVQRLVDGLIERGEAGPAGRGQKLRLRSSESADGQIEAGRISAPNQVSRRRSKGPPKNYDPWTNY
jgi:hypothetical protein